MREFRLSHVNPYSVLRDLLLNLWVIVLCAAIAWMGTQVVLENLHQPEFTSSVTFYITPRDSTQPHYSNINTGYQMAGVLSNLFQSPILAAKSAEAMGLQALPARVDTSVVEYTNLLKLSATATSPELAFRTVKALMENHSQVSNYVVDNAVLEVLDVPSIPAVASNMIPLRTTQSKAVAIATLLGVAALMTLCVLRDTVKTQDAVRELVDAPLYGTLKEEVKNKTLRSKLKKLNKSVLITNPVTSLYFTEAIKQICTRLEYAASLRGLKSILITSSGENEGKSTVAVNLALGLKSRGYRVLLLDGDLKRPAVYKLLDRPMRAGDLAKLLRGEERLEDALACDEQTGLYLLFCRHGIRSSADQLSSQRMAELMCTVTENMDFVIVDSPPLTSAADGEVLASLCSAALLVIRQDHSPVQIINDAIDKLSENTELLGTVFNRSRTLSTPGGNDGYRVYDNRKARGQHR